VGATAKLRGVVLKTTDYGEADRVVALLTEERGKLSAFARAARASRRRFGGALEPFTLVSAELRERPGAELWALESVSVQRAFGAIRGELSRIACAGYACDLSRALVRDHEPHPDLFALLVTYLGRLEDAAPEPAALRAFELGALRAAGLAPRLDACARCGGELAPRGGRLAFGADEGGLLCPRCAALAPRASPCTADGADALRALAAGGLEPAPLPPGVAAEARRLISAFLEHHLGGRLPSRRFLDELGPMLR
jgi:DNA repair protein RecO (recombination protein O)